MDNFAARNKEMIASMLDDEEFQKISQEWYLQADKSEYPYHFSWMGLPIIQYPQDICAMQEIIYEVKPDFIVETGIARGGSLIFYSSMLELLGNNGKVIGIDIDIRQPNKEKILAHPMNKNIIMLEGSSIDNEVVLQVKELTSGAKSILVALDSNHTKEHVLEELKAYAPLVTKDSYLVVFDTQVEFTPSDRFTDKPWQPGNSPYSAVQEFLKTNNRFIIDKELIAKLQITECPGGYLKCLENV